MSKVIFIMVDALDFRTAGERGGFLEHLIEQGMGAKYRVSCGLPSVSRPMYETLMTGLPVSGHMVTANAVSRKSRCESLFSLARKAGLRTGAAAYMWISELYNGTCPFELYRNRYQLDGEGDVMYGIFYTDCNYPDDHLFADGEFLRCTYEPDFLLLHPMNVDETGHRYGCNSPEYQRAADASLQNPAILYERWRAAGYDVILTADHGMDELGIHGGNTQIQRSVPLYLFSRKVAPGDYSDRSISNLNLAPLVCRLLDIPAGEKMQEVSEIRMSEGEAVL